MTRCTDCGTVWHGLTECHCASCCRHFGSIDAFDRHRQGPVDTRHCVDPASVLRRDGKPVLRAVDRSRPATERRGATERSAPTWVVDKPARVLPGRAVPVAVLESEPSEGVVPSPSDPPALLDGTETLRVVW